MAGAEAPALEGRGVGHSRFIWAKIVFDQKVETWVQLHVDFIEALGGVPRTIAATI